MTGLFKPSTNVREELKDLGITFEDLDPETRLFLHGIKPALSVMSYGNADLMNSIGEHLAEQVVSIITHSYYTIIEPRDKHRRFRALVFQNAYNFSEYAKKASVKMVDSPFYTAPLAMLYTSNLDYGITLGYPPSACEWFAEDVKKDTEDRCPQEDKYFIHYHGFNFVTHKSLVKDNIEWLRSTYYIPKEIRGEEYVRTFNDGLNRFSFDDFLSSSLHQG